MYNRSIAVISLRNYELDPQIVEINKHLKYIADFEKCEYGNIASEKELTDLI